mgnify:FL=1
MSSTTSFSTILRSLTTFAARKRYCEANFTKLAAGSGRIVYALDDCRVLKLAKNVKGVAQNTVEGDYGLHDMYDRVITRVFDLDEDGRWLVAERAVRTTKKRFQAIVGLNLELVCTYLRKRSGRYRYWSVPSEHQAAIATLTDDHPFLGGLTALMVDFGMPEGDFCRLSSYGEVCRNGKTQIVLIDYGLTEDVYASHYQH